MKQIIITMKWILIIMFIMIYKLLTWFRIMTSFMLLWRSCIHISLYYELVVFYFISLCHNSLFIPYFIRKRYLYNWDILLILLLVIINIYFHLQFKLDFFYAVWSLLRLISKYSTVKRFNQFCRFITVLNKIIFNVNFNDFLDFKLFNQNKH